MRVTGGALGVLVVLIMLSVAVGPASADSSEDALKARLMTRLEKQDKESSGNVIPVSAGALYKAYKENEVAADAKYKGKWLEVEGRVDHVAKDFTGHPYLALAVDQYGVAQVHIQLFDVQIKEFVKPGQFTVCKDVDKLAILKKGQKVRVEGLGNGAVMSFPVVKSCIFIDPKWSEKK